MYNVVLAGGGTAGHISPLLATAEALERIGDVQLTCIGTPKGLETKIIPDAGYELKLINPVPMPRAINLDLIKLPFRLIKAVRQARKILRKQRADILIGFGGYVSIPAYLAAFLSRIPVVIHEQNALPGISNKVGSWFAKMVVTTFPNTKLRKSHFLGMPLRQDMMYADIPKEEACKFFGMNPEIPTLLVSGGSQGAQSINETLMQAKGELLANGVQILHILGANKYRESQNEIMPNGAGYYPVAYVDNMIYAYGAADMMLGRCGAGTVVETAINGLPSIYIPFPHGNGEQRFNAACVVESGGGLLINNSDLNADRLLAEVLPVIKKPEELAKRSAAIKNIFRDDVADIFAESALRFVKQKGTR